MIEHMSEFLFLLAHIIFILWPLILAAAVAIALRGRKSRTVLMERIRRNLLFAWIFLFSVWVMRLFGPPSNLALIPEPVNTGLFFTGLAATVGGVASLVIKQHRDIHRKMDSIRAIEHFNKLHPTEFEKLIAELYRDLGHRVRHMGQSGDHGVDLEVHTPQGEHWVVQCKRWRESVGEATIRELYGTLLHEKADRGVMVTSAQITPAAENWARGKPIDLVDGAAILRLLDQARRRSILKQSTPVFQRMLAWSQPRRNLIPACPRCKVAMIARPRRVGDRPGRKFYRCANYPDCRIVIVN
jgi:restriction system protein